MSRATVLMPVFNGGRHLEATIQSILGQSFRDFEFVIVNDGSTDASVEVINRLAERDGRIRLYHQSNQGITKALNRGLREATGEFVVRLDSGDLAAANRLERQIEFMDRNPECVAAGSYFEAIDDDGDIIYTRRPSCDHDEIERTLLGHGGQVRGGICHSSAIIRRKDLSEVGGYCEDFRCAQDRDLWLRLGERGRLSNVPEVLLRLRREPGVGISHNRRHEQRAFAIQAIERAHQRRNIPMPQELKLSSLGSTTRPGQLLGCIRAAVRDGNLRTAEKMIGRMMRESPLDRSLWLLVLKVAYSRTRGFVTRSASTPSTFLDASRTCESADV